MDQFSFKKNMFSCHQFGGNKLQKLPDEVNLSRARVHATKSRPSKAPFSFGEEMKNMSFS